MLDFLSGELVVVMIVALVVIGPKDLPRVLRYIGNWIGKARRVANQFRSGFDEMVRQSELEDLEKKWAAENARIMAEHPAPTPEEQTSQREYDSAPPADMTPLPAPEPEAPVKPKRTRKKAAPK
jgi:sec-independent protein translocase protein TatB